MKLSLVTAAAVLALVAAAPAFAQSTTQQEMDAGGDSITIGAAAAYLPDYEGSDDYRIVPAPGAIGSVSGFAFTVAGNRASVDLIPNKPGPMWDIQLGPVAVLDFNRSSIKSIEDVRIKRLGELDTSVELGGFVGIGKTGVITSPYDKLSVSLSYRTDVSGVHRSSIWQPSIQYFTPLSTKAAVGVVASAEHAGSGYARTYFGVTPAQRVASGLPVYTPGGGWKSWNIGALGTVALTGDLLHGFKLVGGANYKRMINDFGDSPVTSIAGSRNQWQLALGLAYTF